MRLGQTTAVHLGSQVVASLAGFVATLYIAQNMGSSALGTYSVFVSVIIWLKTGIGAGFQEAVKKRLSEAEGSARDLGAGLLIQFVVFLVVASVLLAFSGSLDNYFGFEGTTLLVATLALALTSSFVVSSLHGEQKVHIAALLSPLDRIVRSGVQLAVVFLGILGGGVVGLVWGYAAGLAMMALTGIVFLGMRPRAPRRKHFKRNLGFARYSWLSGIEERSFSSMDTVVLGLFVLPQFIGYYEVAWNLASILAVFGTSISTTLFPAISGLSVEDDRDMITDLVNDALAFTGLFIIPGLVGVLIIGDRVLAIYGSEFTQAVLVLVVLVMARLVYAYEAQFVSVLNALDYPEVAFRVNVIFVLTNVGLNVLFVYFFGWWGASIATTIAAATGFILAYNALRSFIAIDFPVKEISRQLVAAGVMGVAIYILDRSIIGAVLPRMFGTILLVGLGAAIYFIALVVFSRRFRMVVQNNLLDVQ